MNSVGARPKTDWDWGREEIGWGGTHPQADQRLTGLGSKQGTRHSDPRVGVKGDPEEIWWWEVGEGVKGHGVCVKLGFETGLQHRKLVRERELGRSADGADAGGKEWFMERGTARGRGTERRWPISAGFTLPPPPCTPTQEAK